MKRHVHGGHVKWIVSAMRSFYHIVPEKWFVLFWMCDFIALTRCCKLISFYRAMHFTAKRGIATACRLSVCPSVSLSVCLSVTLVNCDHIPWISSKIISSLVRLGCSLFATPTWRVCCKGNTPKFGPKVTHPLLIWASETFDRKLRPNGYR